MRTYYVHFSGRHPYNLWVHFRDDVTFPVYDGPPPPIGTVVHDLQLVRVEPSQSFSDLLLGIWRRTDGGAHEIGIYYNRANRLTRALYLRRARQVKVRLARLAERCQSRDWQAAREERAALLRLLRGRTWRAEVWLPLSRRAITSLYPSGYVNQSPYFLTPAGRILNEPSPVLHISSRRRSRG